MRQWSKQRLLCQYQMKPLDSPPTMASRDCIRPAAVLIGLVSRPNGIHVLLTKRAAHLRHHPNQVSFPGGKQDPQDPNLYHTALRETHEEIGILAEQVELIGALPSLETISRFHVTPYLAWVSCHYTPMINQNEVAELFEVPLSVLLEPTNYFQYPIKTRHYSRQITATFQSSHLIWGVTAQILQQLQQHLR